MLARLNLLARALDRLGGDTDNELGLIAYKVH